MAYLSLHRKKIHFHFSIHTSTSYRSVKTACRNYTDHRKKKILCLFCPWDSLKIKKARQDATKNKLALDTGGSYYTHY